MAFLISKTTCLNLQKKNCRIGTNQFDLGLQAHAGFFSKLYS